MGIFETEAAKRRARATQESTVADLLERLAAELPAGLPYARFADVRKGELRVTLAVADRAEAVAAYLAFPATLPLVRYEDTFSGVVPADRIDSEVRLSDKAGVESDLLPAYWELSTPSVANGTCSLIWYVDSAAGVRLRVSAEIANDPARVVRVPVRDHRGRISHYSTEESRLPEGSVIRFSSGSRDTPGNRLVYFPAEPGGAAPTIRDYLGVEHDDTEGS